MAISICPTVTAFEPHGYRAQMERLATFAERIHIDLMDGQFTPTTSPDISQIWWPDHLEADIHLMYRDPEAAIERLIALRPKLVIIHAESSGDHQSLAERLHKQNIRAGLAILPETEVDQIKEIAPHFDHILVFGGDLGKQGGSANLQMLGKVRTLREQLPETEIAWDGGINQQNASSIIAAGANVLDVGSAISAAADPAAAYATLKAIS